LLAVAAVAITLLAEGAQVDLGQAQVWPLQQELLIPLLLAVVVLLLRQTKIPVDVVEILYLALLRLMVVVVVRDMEI
jgi:hypothetical protein